MGQVPPGLTSLGPAESLGDEEWRSGGGLGTAGELMWGVGRSLELEGLEMEGTGDRWSCWISSTGLAGGTGSSSGSNGERSETVNGWFEQEIHTLQTE